VSFEVLHHVIKARLIITATYRHRYAVRESSSRIKLFKAFKEKNVGIRMSFAAEGIFGGALLGVKSSGFLCFYDWETGVCVRRVDVVAKNVRGGFYGSKEDIIKLY
jgi:coatomer subunit beta'